MGNVMNKSKRLFLIAVFCLIFHSQAYGMSIRMDAIKSIESSGNTLAYNKGSGARGLYQITPICLKEWNNLHKSERYNLNQLFDGNINTKIAKWYIEVRIPQMLKHYKKEVSIENIIWAYNAGIGYVVKNIKPLETIDYIVKYQRLTK